MKNIHAQCWYRSLCLITASFFTFNTILPSVVFAQSASSGLLNLPIPGTMLNLTAQYDPTMMIGVNIHPEDPLLFDFIIDSGDATLEGEAFNEETQKLIKYFLAALTVPQEEMWVNLSPYEKNRIIPSTFGQTEMGRDLLAQDYMLKQLTSSLMSPDKGLGEEFWKRVREKAQAQFGTTEVPMNTFNKIWIVPQAAQLYEHEKGAVIVSSHLKVMLEEDYVALEANRGRENHGVGVKAEIAGATARLPVQSGVSQEIIREILIPEIEKEVNEGKTFANLRQIYHSMLLAKWYKENLQQSLLGQVYADKGKVAGVDNADKNVNQKIYDQYVEAFKKGVYDFVKEEYDPTTQQVIPRKYFSGGVAADKAQIAKVTSFDAAQFAVEHRNTKVATFALERTDNAMNADWQVKEYRRQIAMATDETQFQRIGTLVQALRVDDQQKAQLYRIITNRKNVLASLAKNSKDKAMMVSDPQFRPTLIAAITRAKNNDIANDRKNKIIVRVDGENAQEFNASSLIRMDDLIANIGKVVGTTSVSIVVPEKQNIINIDRAMSAKDLTAEQLRAMNTSQLNQTLRELQRDLLEVSADIVNIGMMRGAEKYKTAIIQKKSKEKEAVGKKIDEIEVLIKSKSKVLSAQSPELREEMVAAISQVKENNAAKTREGQGNDNVIKITKINTQGVEALIAEYNASQMIRMDELISEIKSRVDLFSFVINVKDNNVIIDMSQPSKSDVAMTGDFTKGGIDLNPTMVEMNVGRDGAGFRMPLPTPAELEQFNGASGFVPVMINIMPITNLPLWLGASAAQPSYKQEFMGLLGMSEDSSSKISKIN